MTAEEARDYILGVFKTFWDDTDYSAVYSDVPGGPPEDAEPWARATIQHVTGAQASLTGGLGTTKYRANGLVIVQVFAPVGDGRRELYELAEGVVNAYRAARLPVWFRNVRMNEIGKDGQFEQINVIGEFEYDTII